jgi:hypothetical protein
VKDATSPIGPVQDVVDVATQRYSQWSAHTV